MQKKRHRSKTFFVDFYKTMVGTFCAACTVNDYLCFHFVFFCSGTKFGTKKIITGMCREIYHSLGLSDVIPSTSFFCKLNPVSRKTGIKFLIFSLNSSAQSKREGFLVMRRQFLVVGRIRFYRFGAQWTLPVAVHFFYLKLR